MRDSVSGVKGMSPHRPLKNGHFCCRTCLSSCQMCNLGWLHSPPRDRFLTSNARCFLWVWCSTCWRCVSFWFVRVLCVCASSACACSLRVRVLCACAFSVSIWPLSLAAEVLRNSFERGKKIRNRLIYSLLLVEVEQIGQWEELEPPAVLLVLWSTQLSHVFHVSSTQREIWQLLLQHWYSEARAS